MAQEFQKLFDEKEEPRLNLEESNGNWDNNIGISQWREIP